MTADGHKHCNANDDYTSFFSDAAVSSTICLTTGTTTTRIRSLNDHGSLSERPRRRVPTAGDTDSNFIHVLLSQGAYPIGKT